LPSASREKDLISPPLHPAGQAENSAGGGTRLAAGLNDLAMDYQGQGKYAGAESLFRRPLEMRRKLLGA